MLKGKLALDAGKTTLEGSFTATVIKPASPATPRQPVRRTVLGKMMPRGLVSSTVVSKYNMLDVVVSLRATTQASTVLAVRAAAELTN